MLQIEVVLYYPNFLKILSSFTCIQKTQLSISHIINHAFHNCQSLFHFRTFCTLFHVSYFYFIDALSVINRFLDDSTFVTNHLKIDTNDSNDPITDDKDLIFLRKYLKRSSLRHCFNVSNVTVALFTLFAFNQNSVIPSLTECDFSKRTIED